MPAAAFLWLCAWLNFTGWTLSALHQLNAAGYTISLLLFAAGFCFWRSRAGNKNFPRSCVHKFFRRCRRPLPAFFLLAAGLIFLGGAWYAPTNFDALTYRLPRLLNWWQAGHWFWIPTVNERMNYSGTAWEWIALPFFVLTHSDRGLFLINALGFLLLPGFLFSIFRHAGVARKVAWTWMWLLPLGYGYITQAGSVGNDLTGTLFFLAAIHFALRARRSDQVGDVWLTGLAAALLTGAKLSNLPLLLPCLVAVWPALPLLRKKIIASLAVAVIAAMISALPIMVLNQLHTGSWNGDPHNEYQMQLKNPVAAVLGNSLLLAEQSFMPPALPGSSQLNDRITRALPDFLNEKFPRLRFNRLNEVPGEEGAGLGLGITLPLLLALGFSLGGVRQSGFKGVAALLPPIAIATWIGLLVFMAKIGSEAGPRLLLPYYPLALIPLLMLPAQRALLRARAWRFFLGLTALSVLPALILSMSRPLWPAQTVSQKLAQAHPDNKTLQRLATTYTTYAQRNDFLAPIRAALPADVAEIGFIAGANDSEYSFWRPFGRRQVIELRADADHFFQHPGEVEWVVIKANEWPQLSPVALATWAEAHHAKIVATRKLTELVSWGPEDWCLLQFEKNTGTNAAAAP